MKSELEKNKDLILEVLDKGIIYYYNRIGKVVELSCNCVTPVGAICNLGATKFYFKYEDFNKKWFLSTALAHTRAQEYKEQICCIYRNTLKKIIKLKAGDTIFVKGKDFDIYAIGLGSYVYYDKYKLSLININGDDYEEENEYKISDYGNKWALTKEELK